MNTKKCFRCKKEKPVQEYYKDKKAKDGLRASCKPCLVALDKKWCSENREKVRAYGRGRKEYLRNYRKDKQKERALEARKYRAKHKDKYRASRRRHYSENKENLLAYRAEYIKKNPWFNRAASSRKRAELLQRTPKWADADQIKKDIQKLS